MFIYNGKFNWFNYASNETITIVFPAGFALNDPVSGYWQWSTEDSGNKKGSVGGSGTVQSVTTEVDGSSRFLFNFSYYSFTTVVSADFKTLTVTMRSPKGDISDPFSLGATHINPTNIPSTVVYTGRLGQWFSYAKDETTTLVVPYGVAEGMFFGLYYQWTVDAKGVEKANAPINGVFQDVQYGADGSITAKFNSSYYTFNFTFNGKQGSFVLSNPKGEKSADNKFALAYTL